MNWDSLVMSNDRVGHKAGVALRFSHMLAFVLLLTAGIVFSLPSVAEDMLSAHQLRAGDVLEINVYEHPELLLKTRVGTEGTIRFPRCDVIQAAGLTAAQLENTIAEKLSAAGLERVQVFVYVEEYTPRLVYVLGAVNRSPSESSPGSGALPIPPEGRLTALQAISAVGGFSPQSDIDNVFIIRTAPGKNSRQTILVPVRDILSKNSEVPDVPLQPGDMLVVHPGNITVSVMGEVAQPGAYPLDPLVPAMAAEIISRAGGFLLGADRDRVTLLRDGQTMNLKLANLMAGKNTGVVDKPLRSGDTLICTSQDKVYVLGGVRAAGAFNLLPEIPLTVSRAIALAGGTEKDAADDSIVVIRNNENIRVNLRRQLKPGVASEAELVLQPGDAVYVPMSRW